ncbi:hypothetical protein ACFW5W_28480 [Streptomyces sp. NPDC058783]|uniref:hypothetical protein n=1 Tax=Streptomyces sp. NPDC058783 TaxID=3346633 RepID=UPI0036CBF6CA
MQHDMDRAPRVDFERRPATYLVIADDADALLNWAENRREDRLPERRVVHVERQADHPVERAAQWDELHGSVLDAEADSLSLLTCTAVSHAHAAAVARHEYDMANAAARMIEVIDTHVKRGGCGWVAIRIATGGSDGELYDGYEDARAAQQHPERCTYFPVSALSDWTPRMAEEHLEITTHHRHGCMVYGVPSCH